MPEVDWHDIMLSTPGIPSRLFLPVKIVSEIFRYVVQADRRSRTNLVLVCRDWHDVMLSTPVIHYRFPLPVEIVSEIFLYMVQADPRSRTNLILVCRYWHHIMLSTPGIHSQLRIDRSTSEKDVERFGRGLLLDVTIDTGDKWEFFGPRPVSFHQCFKAAAKAADRWRSLAIHSLLPPGKCKDLQITHPLAHLESFKLAASCDLGNFLVPLTTAIATTVTPRFNVMEVFHPDAALYLVQSAHFQNFSSLTTLRLVCKRMQNPVDILPALHRLEIFEAHHLSLQIHPLGVDLPLTQTLRDLQLKSVSVQWMTGQTFSALEKISIIFPQRANAIQLVSVPSCSALKYYSNNLGALEHFHFSRLDKLEVICNESRKWSGDLQLAALRFIFAAQSLTRLQLEIRCSEQLLAYMLRLVPALEELWMGLLSPHALSSAFFLAFAAGGRNAIAGPPDQTIAPLCRQLKMLRLHYKRWSRGAERNALIPAFGAIVASHPPEEQKFSLWLKFDEGLKSREWKIHEPVERYDSDMEHDRIFIGVSSPYGIVPVSSLGHSEYGRDVPSLLPETEYIITKKPLTLPIDYLYSQHRLKEVRMINSHLKNGSNAPLSLDEPIFHTLTTLTVFSAPWSIFAGQAFHKLERYQEQWNDFTGTSIPGYLTEMAVCTRLSAPLSRIATLKLPRIRELVVLFDRRASNYLWKKHIAVTANLSGLTLLGLCAGHDEWAPLTGITKVLTSLSALETLVLDSQHIGDPFVTFFQAFIPMETSGLEQSSCEGQISGEICPRLQSLHIEGIDLTGKPELMPVLKDIVTRRAIIGSPLRSFTFYLHHSWTKKWELIGRDGSFIMEEVVPAQRFRCDI